MYLYIYCAEVGLFFALIFFARWQMNDRTKFSRDTKIMVLMD